MRLNSIVLLIVIVLLLVFAAFNFDALLAQQPVNVFGAASYSAPLGLILLLIAIVVALVFTLLAALAGLQAQAEQARTLREMERLRANLADQEASRLEALRALVEERFGALQTGGTSADLAARVEARVDRVRDELAADLGQLEDYLRRRLGSDDGALPPPDLQKPR